MVEGKAANSKIHRLTPFESRAYFYNLEEIRTKADCKLNCPKNFLGLI